MVSKPNSNKQRQIRHMRVRNKISGTAERPRLSVYRSLNNIYAQVIDDVAQNTIVSASTLDEELKGKLKGTGNKEAAKAVGEKLVQVATAAGIKTVCFDRGGYIYHGRIAELAEGARSAGLDF